MLLSPSVIYKSLTSHTLQQCSRHLLGSAATQRVAQKLPVSTQQQSLQQLALSASLQHLQRRHMTTSQKQRSQPETAQHLIAGAKTKAPGRGSKPCKAVTAAVAAALCSTEPSTSSNGSEHFALLDRWVLCMRKSAVLLYHHVLAAWGCAALVCHSSLG
jgi:hypothetical protein